MNAKKQNKTKMINMNRRRSEKSVKFYAVKKKFKIKSSKIQFL